VITSRAQCDSHDVTALELQWLSNQGSERQWQGLQGKVRASKRNQKG
jgi:hypothetical protein